MFAIVLMICGRSNACSSLYHSDSLATKIAIVMAVEVHVLAIQTQSMH